MDILPVLKCKCPRCKQGDIFKFPLSKVSHFSEMNSHCANCGASFEPEPGFYFGALYVSYGFNVAFFVGISLFLAFTFDPPTWVYMVSIVLCSIIFLPVSFRYSRVLFLYWFGGLKSK